MIARVCIVAALLVAPVAAFVPSIGAAPRVATPAVGAPRIAAPILVAEAEASEESAMPISACLMAGLGLGYAAAVGGAVTKRGKVTRNAEGKPKVQAARVPVAYPIFTFRWLAVHMLTVP